MEPVICPTICPINSSTRDSFITVFTQDRTEEIVDNKVTEEYPWRIWFAAGEINHCKNVKPEGCKKPLVQPLRLSGLHSSNNKTSVISPAMTRVLNGSIPHGRIQNGNAAFKVSSVVTSGDLPWDQTYHSLESSCLACIKLSGMVIFPTSKIPTP